MTMQRKSLVGWIYEAEFPFSRLPFTSNGYCFSLFPKLNHIQKIEQKYSKYLKVRITIEEIK